ncbi:hypothetical protein [uncultured Eubacterium sp.]|uniref:hypothetical protein n=1 Tax=uncultured Eubacterium sp. TaxID=165185 RepID=UPI002671ABF1|nr:hypothetical protein [uncultured Eubacterium sp.]
MNNFDEMIRKKLNTDYENVTLDLADIDRITDVVKNGRREKKVNDRRDKNWKKLVAIAAVFLVIIIVANNNTIKAFVVGMYEKYFGQLDTEYENNTDAYARDLNLEYSIDGKKVIIKQYVVTDRGIDFKVAVDEDSGIDICGATVYKSTMQAYNEMVVKVNGYYILSTVFEDTDWLKRLSGDNKIKARIELMYMVGGEDSDVYCLEKQAEIDLSKIYHCKRITNKNVNILKDKNFEVTNIFMSTWYMKVSYKRKDALKDNSILTIRQNGTELLNLGGQSDNQQVYYYYQLPKTWNEPIEISLGQIDYERGDIVSRSEVYKVDLKTFIKEDSANEN